MGGLRWRPDEPAPAPATSSADAATLPPSARIASPIAQNPIPDAPLTLDEPPAPRKAFPEANTPSEMIWRTQVGPPPGLRPLPESAFPPVVTSANAPTPATMPLPALSPVASGETAGVPHAPPATMPGTSVVVSSQVTITPSTQVTVYKLERPVEFDKRIALLRDPDSPAAAAYRVLRHRLVERGNPRVVVVTSPGPREGKTTCAVNLALALGECGRARVLLVEANLRAPRLAEMLAFMPPSCFSEQVAAHRDQPEEPWMVVEAHSPWLHVAAVKPEVRDQPLVDGPAFAIAIDQLRHAGYDYVVIDTPPVLGTADVNLTQDCADGVLFVVRSRHTAGRHLRRAIEQLQPARILGVVMLEAPR